MKIIIIIGMTNKINYNYRNKKWNRNFIRTKNKKTLNYIDYNFYFCFEKNVLINSTKINPLNLMVGLVQISKENYTSNTIQSELF